MPYANVRIGPLVAKIDAAQNEAGSFGIVRARDKCSADLRGILAGDDTEPKRLFCADVTRPEILPWMLSVRGFDLASNGG
jgi:hypothetical protein